MSDSRQDSTGDEVRCYAEPVLGFRIWALRDDKLHGAAYDQLWTRGENVAVCRRDSAPHETAPATGCRCGFNALHELPAPAWSSVGIYVMGAIAAWGEIEWHRTGFRAERACPIALCFDPANGAGRRAEVDAVAARYGIEAVPRAQLIEHASRFARSLAPPAPPPPAPVQPKPAPAGKRKLWEVAGGRGHWIARHVVADWWGGHVSVGVASGLAQRLDADARLLTLAPGSTVAEGDALAVLHTRSGSYAVASPVAGRVSGANGEVLDDPRLAAVEPSEGGWIVRLAPAGTLLDDCPLVWGRRGREQYDAFLARIGDERILDDVRLSHHLAGSRLRCAEEAVSLMRERLRHQATRHARRLQAA